MSDESVSGLPDADMQATLAALKRAAQRARETARRTNTPLIIVRDGVLVEEWVTDTDGVDEGSENVSRAGKG